jgi:hypothetical protein
MLAGLGGLAFVVLALVGLFIYPATLLILHLLYGIELPNSIIGSANYTVPSSGALGRPLWKSPAYSDAELQHFPKIPKRRFGPFFS